MDTAKAANLFANYPEAELEEFINAPIGRGSPIERKLSPLIASECPRLVVRVELNILSPYYCCKLEWYPRVIFTKLNAFRAPDRKPPEQLFSTSPRNHSKQVLHLEP